MSTGDTTTIEIPKAGALCERWNRGGEPFEGA